MESLLNFQLDCATRLQKSYANYKKSPKERITKNYLLSRLESLEQTWKEFVTGHKELVQTADPKQLKAESYITNDVYGTIVETYIDYKCTLKTMLDEFEKPDNQNKQGPTAAESSGIKLPKITIPVFSGKYTEWPTFRDLFQSMIHTNKNLKNVQKLHYLKSFLTGEAEQLLRHIPITDNNYSECWSLLETRYNNKKYLSHCILKRLLSQKSATVESANSLKELIDTSTDCLNALKNLGIDVSSWDIIVIHILTLKLDMESRKQWELNITSNLNSDQLPTYKQFQEFITSRYRALEFVGQKNKPQQPGPSTNKQTTFHVASGDEAQTSVCPCCFEPHKLIICKKFLEKDNNSRREFVQTNGICFNCLGINHTAKYCKSVMKCKVCKRHHHTLLHPKQTSTTATTTTFEETPNESNDEEEDEPISVNTAALKSPAVLLATALVGAETKNGDHYTVRALIDQGSQASFVTEATVQMLRLKKSRSKGVISGVGGGQNVNSNAVVTLKLKSLVEPNVNIFVKAHVLKSITSFLPGKKIIELNWVQSTAIKLADPQYHTPNKIDVLLGAEVYSQILKEGIKKDPTGRLVAQSTSLGWIISGVVNDVETAGPVLVMHAVTEENDLLKKFWELESDANLTNEQKQTEEEKKCEKIFQESTTRDKQGRYIVRLPFRDENPECTKGEFRSIAEKRLKGLQKRLDKDLQLKQRYCEVMEEYLQLGHMEEIKESDNKRHEAVYLPHHAVVREDKDTTKVRVVFNASQKGKNGVSLNDNLLVGPKLQPELRHLVMRWRLAPICLTADIVKMYRQVKVHNSDVDFQRLLWQNEDGIKDYRLLRVTFGTASAPFLAVRALQQVALDDGKAYPFASNRVIQDFYMDDLMTGCENIEEGKMIVNQMNELLNKAGFTLQKWSSNNNKLLEQIKHVNGSDVEEGKEGLHLKTDEIIKILGLTWERSSDQFRYMVKLSELGPPITKRKMLSDISRLFDPLGWITPCIIVAKTAIQKLWLSGIEWDEEVPKEILSEWCTYRNELVKLMEVRIPRWIGTKLNDKIRELHGFCDASKLAYAAVVYSRVIDAEGNIHVSLITAKSRVAPIKQVSIPRLELCGAVMVSRLMVEVAKIMNIEKNHLHAWTDSTIVLAWLNKHPSKWNVFVANRVSEILLSLEPQQWSHVSTKQNPADCASRGLTPSEINRNELWFNGPQFLGQSEIKYEKPQDLTTHLESVKAHNVNLEPDIWEKFSSLSNLVRVIAYCRRFLRKTKSEKKEGYLKSQELQEALETYIRKCQNQEFEEEIKDLKRKKQVKRRSPIKSLNPYLDDKNLLRVGGRLENSQLGYYRKHPVIIPKKSHVAKLMIANAHQQTLHGGIQLTLNYLNEKYCITGGKQLVKAHIRKCVTCVKNAGVTKNPLMGQLPNPRVTPSRPFLSSGVDFAGPIQLRTSKGRGQKSYKGYICLFICMCTRAVHIEAVSDLTTVGFLAAFKRFVSRRGHCQQIWSDNGTNFVGAASELRKLFISEKDNLLNELAEPLANNGTSWHFIPPHTPNFGGLWEAGIKSVKFHLKRVIGESTLTFEEMTTLLAQVEACLNSRPLSQIDDDRELVLTPGHFLVGEPLVTAPDYNYEASAISPLKRWQYTQRMLQEFWRKWSQEYLTQFLRRYRWSKETSQPKLNDVVLVKENDLPPSRWLYGKIVALHPGPDKIIRVVSLKTKNSIIKRPTSKLCVLPVSD